jgi:hypothetical protein
MYTIYFFHFLIITAIRVNGVIIIITIIIIDLYLRCFMSVICLVAVDSAHKW